MGPLNISFPWQIKSQRRHQSSAGGNVQKSPSSKAAALFDARSVHGVREHGKRARTPLAAFFNIPRIISLIVWFWTWPEEDHINGFLLPQEIGVYGVCSLAASF
jgi:hypothetical protein